MDITEIKNVLIDDLLRIETDLAGERAKRAVANDNIKRLLEERKEAARLVNATKPRKKRADAKTPLDTGV